MIYISYEIDLLADNTSSHLAPLPGDEAKRAAVEPHDRMVEAGDQGFVVRRDDYGGADLVELLEEIEEAHADVGVDVAGPT